MGCEQWLHGPKWLLQPELEWPKPKIVINSVKKEQILKECKLASARVNLIINPIMYRGENNMLLLHAFSDWQKIVRITAYVLRYVNNLRWKAAKKRKMKTVQCKHRTGKYISTEERLKAANYWIRIAQMQHYKPEIECLKSKDDKFPQKSKIAALKPFLDADGMLRAGGRISNAHCAYSKKHPILIPPKSKVCELILQRAHTDTLHGGIQSMMAYIRNNYWIRCLRSELRRIVLKCVHCVRQAGLTSQQIMSDLPMDRVVPARPFCKCGVDFAGPFNMKLADRIRFSTRNRAELPEVKGYVAVFV